MNDETNVEEKKQNTEEIKHEDKKPKKDKTIKIKESEHIALIEELAQVKDKHVRLYAEFDNMRKRMEREKVDFVKYANEGLMLEVLTILDSLEFSLKSAKEKETAESLIKGLEMVLTQMKDLLKRNNVKPIETVGKKFDLNCHEVLMQEETDKHEEGEVIEEFQRGYYFGDRVLRTAKVKIAKAKQLVEESKEETQEETKE